MNKKAFTLIELLIVISVITIVSAIAVSSLNNYLPNTRLRGDKNMLVGDLRKAQQQAVTEQKRHIIKFDNSVPSEPKYQYILLENENEEVLSSREFSRGILVDISGVPDREFSFGASGAPINGGSTVLTNERGQTKTVEVTPAGQIK